MAKGIVQPHLCGRPEAGGSDHGGSGGGQPPAGVLGRSLSRKFGSSSASTCSMWPSCCRRSSDAVDQPGDEHPAQVEGGMTGDLLMGAYQLLPDVADSVWCSPARPRAACSM